MKTVSKIIIYPIKSLNGISVTNSKVTNKGLQFDRQFMLLNVKENEMITLRNFPELYNIHIEIKNSDKLFLKHKIKNLGSIELSLNPEISNNSIKETKVWDDLVEVKSWSPEANEWFSKILGIECELVKMNEDYFRQVDQRYSSIGQGVNFADGFPFLICSEASLFELNNQLNSKVTIDYFRPNIVFSNGFANEEFDWAHFEIRGNIFNSFKPCARCQVITINPYTLETNKEILPLMSKNYRKNGKIIFGLNACLKSENEDFIVKIGDKISSINKGDLK